MPKMVPKALCFCCATSPWVQPITFWIHFNLLRNAADAPCHLDREPRANWQRGLLTRLPATVMRGTGTSLFLMYVCRWHKLFILMRDVQMEKWCKERLRAAERGFCAGMLSRSLAICWPHTRRFADSGTDLRPQAVVSGWGLGDGGGVRGICSSVANNHLSKFSSSVWCQSDYLVPQIKSALPPPGFPRIINTKTFLILRTSPTIATG